MCRAMAMTRAWLGACTMIPRLDLECYVSSYTAVLNCMSQRTCSAYLTYTLMMASQGDKGKGGMR